VAFNDMTSRHLVSQRHKRGLHVPDDMALVAGITEPMLCLHPAPSLTSIEVPYEEIGYQAARQSTNFLAVADPLVAAVLQYLVASSHRRISVPEVTTAVHASRRTLERRFVAALGRSPAQEIRRLRMERAKRHLIDSPLPVKTIAHMAGFANEQRLYEAFQQYEGTSPSQ